MTRHRGRAWGPSLAHHCLALGRRVIRETVAFLVPVVCAGCGENDVSVCATCRDALCNSILTRTLDGVPVYSAAHYSGRVKRMLLAVKRDGRVDAASALGIALHAAITAALADAEGRGIELATVPASLRSRQRRGFVPVDLMVRRAGFGRSRVLAWRRRPRDQIGLGRAQRTENLAGAIRSKNVRGRRFIVVDDVVTSGATLSECVRALRLSGGEIVACATVASTPLRLATPGRDQSVTRSGTGATV